MMKASLPKTSLDKKPILPMFRLDALVLLGATSEVVRKRTFIINFRLHVQCSYMYSGCDLCNILILTGGISLCMLEYVVHF